MLIFQVIVPKLKNEPLGVVIVESGWGSMVPTVVLANMAPSGAAARCGQLNIGDQIMSINGVSLVGLPLSSCQNYIKVHTHLYLQTTKHIRAARLGRENWAFDRRIPESILPPFDAEIVYVLIGFYFYRLPRTRQW